MPPGDCEILRPFCCPADGAAMGAAAPGRDMGKESKEGAAGRGRAGRRGQGDRHSLRSGASALPPCASPAALPRYPRISGEPVAPLSPGEPVALPPAPCPPPACRPLLAFLPHITPGRGCSHGCAWLAYLRSFRFLLANTRFTAICDNF